MHGVLVTAVIVHDQAITLAFQTEKRGYPARSLENAPVVMLSLACGDDGVVPLDCEIEAGEGARLDLGAHGRRTGRDVPNLWSHGQAIYHLNGSAAKN